MLVNMNDAPPEEAPMNARHEHCTPAHRHARVITPVQCRMARAALCWTQGDLARRSGTHRNTVRDFETGKRVAMPRTLRDLTETLEEHGVALIEPSADGPGMGVRLMR